MSTMTAPTYTCAQCGGVYEFVWSDDEALAEMRENFGEVPESERCIVCDDCYQEMVSIVPPAEWRENGEPEELITDLLTPEAVATLDRLLLKSVLGVWS